MWSSAGLQSNEMSQPLETILNVSPMNVGVVILEYARAIRDEIQDAQIINLGTLCCSKVKYRW